MSEKRIAPMLSVLFVASLLQGVYSHGLLTSPAGRQYKASLDRGQTLQYEDCPHCMNRGGVCGVSQTDASKNYLYPKDNFGNVIVPTVDECYSPGQDIVLKFVLTAHHRGHIEVKLCPDHLNPTQACFDQYPLEFLEDQSYSERANKDSNHPDRGYLHPNNGRANPPDSLETPFGGGMPYTMRFKIPENIGQCDHCVLQWTYVTGNSCNAHGYRSYNFPSEDWWAPYLSDCPNPLPKEGLATSLPEQFWNCADVQISNTCGSATPSENENQDQDQDQDGDADADADADANQNESSNENNVNQDQEQVAGEEEGEASWAEGIQMPEQEEEGSGPCSAPEQIIPSADCKTYRICDGNLNLTPSQACVDGTLFSVEKNYCDWAPNVVCGGGSKSDVEQDQAQAQQQEQEQTNDLLSLWNDNSKSDTNEDTSALDANDGGASVFASNPAQDKNRGKKNKKNKKGKKNKKNKTTTTQGEAGSCSAPEQIIPSADCKTYRICDGNLNLTPSQACADGTLFSVEKNYCDWAPNVEC